MKLERKNTAGTDSRPHRCNLWSKIPKLKETMEGRMSIQMNSKPRVDWNVWLIFLKFIPETSNFKFLYKFQNWNKEKYISLILSGKSVNINFLSKFQDSNEKGLFIFAGWRWTKKYRRWKLPRNQAKPRWPELHGKIYKQNTSSLKLVIIQTKNYL